MVSCIASTSDRAIKPFPTSGWFVITAKMKPLQTGCGFGVKPEILQPLRGEAAPVTEFRNDDNPIPIKKYGRPQPVGTAYHFVCLRCKAGWLTRQCHTTA